MLMSIKTKKKKNRKLPKGKLQWMAHHVLKKPERGLGHSWLKVEKRTEEQMALRVFPAKITAVKAYGFAQLEAPLLS